MQSAISFLSGVVMGTVNTLVMKVSRALLWRLRLVSWRAYVLVLVLRLMHQSRRLTTVACSADDVRHPIRWHRRQGGEVREAHLHGPGKDTLVSRPGAGSCLLHTHAVDTLTVAQIMFAAMSLSMPVYYFYNG